jgi:hypothetical protein
MVVTFLQKVVFLVKNFLSHLDFENTHKNKINKSLLRVTNSKMDFLLTEKVQNKILLSIIILVLSFWE